MSDFILPRDLPATMAPFTNGNFKLTVLSAMMDAGQLNLGNFPLFLKLVEGIGYDYEEDGYEPSAKARDYLERYPLDDAQLAQVETLYFDGGLSIYPFIHPFWDGENSQFDIPDLRDIALLPNLREFGFATMLQSNDLAPLRNLPKLEVLDLGDGGPWRNFQVLAGLDNLRILTFSKGAVVGLAAERALATLRARGVAINPPLD